jgi:hypothetical protein
MHVGPTSCIPIGQGESPSSSAEGRGEVQLPERAVGPRLMMEEVGENMGRMVSTESAQDCTVEWWADQTEVMNTITRLTKSTPVGLPRLLKKKRMRPACSRG